MALNEVKSQGQQDLGEISWVPHSSVSMLMILRDQGYEVGQVIGEGSYCKVRTARRYFNEYHSMKMACKVIDKRKGSSDFSSKFLPRELKIVKDLKHPNIIQVYDIFENTDHVFIFMNICEKGDLLEYIKRKGALPEYKARGFFRQLVSAVLYLHKQDISHRDVKCENIFLTAQDKVVLGDFGFARKCIDKHQKRVLSETFCGSAAYAAPEILQGIPYNPKMYDVWSLGCVLFIMLTSSMPFDDSNVQEMIKQQVLHQLETYRFNLRPSVDQLLHHMLHPDITRRATIYQISHAPWLREHYYNNFYPTNPANYGTGH